jgi:dienelactone hydrolase
MLIRSAYLKNRIFGDFSGRRIAAACFVFASVLLTACGPGRPAIADLPSQPAPSEAVSLATATLPPPELRTVTQTPAPTTLPPQASATIGPSETPTVSPTPDPYAGLSVSDLAARSYGGGELQVHESLAVNSYFTRTLISYPSDGLTIYGFMNVPHNAEGPFPVVIALHGYIEPAIYDTIDYTTRYADALARAGFLVLHPNLRGYPPSDEGENLFRVGMAIDVMNLIALVKELGGQPGPLELADPQAIGLWGHSMGGGISTRVITVNPDVRAAVLYGAMSGDEKKNFERIFSYFSNGTRGQEELGAPEEAFLRISPIYFLDNIQAAVSIHHGKEDPDVPLAWSIDLCSRLKDSGKNVECFTYEGLGHTFHGEGDELFMQRMIDFFNRELR